MYQLRHTCKRWLSTSAATEPLKGSGRVADCMHAILDQHAALIESLPDNVYTFQSPLLQASIGQHTRHSLDHLRKPLELLQDEQSSREDRLIQYDRRSRHTPIETDRHAALDQIKHLQRQLQDIDAHNVQSPVQAAFMLSSDGQEYSFQSTFSREMAFAVHHCIHHNALSKVLLNHHYPSISVPPDFGKAPSTANFESEVAS